MSGTEEQIARLYTVRRLSVQQVSDRLTVTPAKVRYVLDRRGVKRRSISDAIRSLNVTKFKKGEFKIKKRLSARGENLKLAGVMLYWGEGTKSGNSVVLSNSDPRMVSLFLKFLREVCGIAEKRLRVLLHIYSDHNEQILIKYWMSITKIPLSQFSRSFLHTRAGGTYKRISKYGTVSLRYSDTKLLEVINMWIQDYQHFFLVPG